ncbi:TlpA disulfide reductase family protein [Lacibacter sp. MH-610]|uniref:peroxiredoxin family protein n=1 Tax=Lacibacter sp. MH-610 TaxID=3020883 RepID=UPI0038917C49
MLRYLLIAFLLNAVQVQAQVKTGWYRAVIQRADSVAIVFNAEAVVEKGKTVLYIRNHSERLKVEKIELKEDSVLIDMPFFESSFQLKKQSDHSLTGTWIKGTSRTTPLQLPVTFYYGNSQRFKVTQQPKALLTGRWQVTFTRAAGGERPAVAFFQQKGNYVSGSFITPSGDYRFLEGVLNGNKLQLSCFDGSHAYYFKADVTGTNITNGFFYSSASAPEQWRAVKNSKAALPDTTQRTQLKEDESRLNFSFKDINGKTVSINDEQFKNKVVIIQLMGSWCPNCMDETEFLKGFYAQYKTKGVELIALAYELSPDETRSRTSLQKFINRFEITYPVLIAPATSSDPEKTEKTLPQLTPIRSFPTTIFIGRDGTVQQVHSGFYGPGTGDYHEAFKKEFYQIVNRLLSGAKPGEH